MRPQVDDRWPDHGEDMKDEQNSSWPLRTTVAAALAAVVLGAGAGAAVAAAGSGADGGGIGGPGGPGAPGGRGGFVGPPGQLAPGTGTMPPGQPAAP